MTPMIVTTMLKVYIIDTDGIHSVLDGNLSVGTAHYHGVTWDNKGYVYLSETVDFKYVIGIYRFRKDHLEWLAYLNNADLHETHQIFWYKGLLLVVNTGKNRVEIIDTTNPFAAWYNKAWNPSPCDIDHINGIWAAPYGRVYVVEHRQKSDGISIVRCCTPDLVEEGKFVIGPNIHNVYVENGYVYNLTSPHDGDPAAILSTFTGDVRSHVPMQFPQWGTVLLRGLARAEHGWYIGMSRWDEDRSKRHVGDGIVKILDNDFHEVHEIILRNSGPICDVRLLRGDKAHNGVDLL